MKLWFEGWNVNAHEVLPLQRMPHRLLSFAANSAQD
jgi:hypothetical protein